MNTHILINIADLEAVRDKAEKNAKECFKHDHLDSMNSYYAEVAAYDKILTHYKKVDLSEETVNERSSLLGLRTLIDKTFQRGYKSAIRDILS